MPAEVAITGKEVVEYAVTIGTGRPYVLGASGPNAYDCSGLIVAVFKHFAIATFPNLPREAGAQARWLAVNGKQISIAAASSTPGAVLAIDKGPSGSGAGGNHIGFCLSPGLSFEARSARYGIGSWVLSTRKWTGAYLIPHVDYSFKPPDPLQEDDDMPAKLIRKTSTGAIEVYANGVAAPFHWADPNDAVRNVATIGRLAKAGLVEEKWIELDDDAFDALPRLVP